MIPSVVPYLGLPPPPYLLPPPRRERRTFSPRRILFWTFEGMSALRVFLPSPTWGEERSDE